MESETRASDPESVLRRLEPVRLALGADGYELECDDADVRSVSLRIRATGDACPDCLVPKPMMERMVADQLGTAVVIRLRYPEE